MLPRISRFNYWDFIDINPIFRELAKDKHFELERFRILYDISISTEYKNKYSGGDENAIFQYAELNPLFIHQQWVRHEIQKRLLQGDKEAKKWCMKLFFGSKRGRRNEMNPEGLINIIKRDKQIYFEILDLRKKGYKLTGSVAGSKKKDTHKDSIFFQLATKYTIAEDSIHEIYKEYHKFYISQGDYIFRCIESEVEPLFISKEMGSSIPKKVSQTINNLTKEILEIIKYRQEFPDRKEDKYINTFANSVLTNLIHEWWFHPITKYYQYRLSEDGFTRFLNYCELKLENGKISLKIHNAYIAMIEAVYTKRIEKYENEIQSNLDAIFINKTKRQ